MYVVTVYDAYQIDVVFDSKVFDNVTGAYEFFYESCGMGKTVIIEDAEGCNVNFDTQIDPEVMIDEEVFND